MAIDLYFWSTPNGVKISIMLEELGLPYRVVPVDITKGEQHDAAFLRISPNGRIPAIVDHDNGATPVFESGAILLYLAERYGQFVPTEPLARIQCLEWLFWQVGGLGPMAGQLHHFRLYAPEPVPYAQTRYDRETRRLYGVLEARLQQTGSFLCDDYSIADIACLPWIWRHPRQGIELDDYPAIAAWYAVLMKRPAVQRGLALEAERRDEQAFTSESARHHLFNND